MIDKEIEYEIKKNKKYSLYLKKIKDVRFGTKILNIAICPEISHLLISTKFCFYKIYTYNEFLLHSRSKYEIMPFVDEIVTIIKSNCTKSKNYQPKIIFEFSPYSDDKISLAIGIDKTVIVVFLSKKKQVPYEIEHFENSICKFIQWENDLLVLAFENKIIKIIKNNDILKTFKDDDNITSMKIIHFQDFKLLVCGYNKKVIIRNFYSILNIDSEFKPFIILKKLEGTIDIIEYNNQYILFCSKSNNIIYCYRFMNNNWKPIPMFDIYKFKNAEEDQEIINVKLVPDNGIIVCTKKRIYIYYIKTNKEELNYILKYHDICFFTLLYNRKFYYYYCLIGLKNSIKIIRFEEIKKSSDYYKYTIEENKESINTWINTLLNRKNQFTIIKLEDYKLKVEIDDVILKIDFNVTDKTTKIYIIKCDDFGLKSIIEEEIEALKKVEEENEEDILDLVTEKLIKLNSIIKSFNNQDSSSEEIIEKKNLLKIEATKFLSCYKYFKNWQLIVKKREPINNLFKDEEDFDSYNKIMSLSIKEIANWDFSFEKLDIDKAFNFIKSEYDVPFLNLLIKKNENNNNNISIKNSITIKNDKEKLLKDSYEKDNFRINEEKKYKLNKESFNYYINKININFDSGHFLILVDILKQIKYFVVEILNQKSNNLRKLYSLDLLNIFVLLESQLNLELLFICSLPLSLIIYNEIIKKMKKKENQIQFSPKNLIKESRINNDNNLKPNKNVSCSSSKSNSNDDNFDVNNSQISDLNLITEETKNNTTNIHNNNNNELKHYIEKSPESSNNDVNFFYKTHYSKNSEDLISFSRKNKNRSNASFYSLTNKNNNNLIEIFGPKFCNIIIDFVIFFSEELKKLDNDLKDTNIIDFFILVNKYYEIPGITNEINEISEIIKKAAG